jgi:hypothetical protein
METVDSSVLYIAIVLLIGGLVTSLVYVATANGKRLADSIPPTLLPVITLSLEIAVTLAKQTPTLEDDKLIERLRELMSQTPPATPEKQVIG